MGADVSFRSRAGLVTLFGLLWVWVPATMAEVVPAALFRDGMVLQREKKIPVWGRADPGEEVTVTLGDARVSVEAGAEGRWRMDLPPSKARSEPLVMVIAGKNVIQVKNVLVGEVFVAGGQSNMEVPVKEAMNPQEEAAAADYPLIRIFTVENDWHDRPQENCKGSWTTVRPDTVSELSAISYFYARELQRTLEVPVGIINNAVSATPAEAWTPADLLQARPELYKPYLEPMKLVQAWGKEAIVRQTDETMKRVMGRRAQMKGRLRMTNDGPRYIENAELAKEVAWIQGELPPEGWITFDVTQPCPLFNKDLAGAFRFRKVFTLPAEVAGSDLKLTLTNLEGVSAYLDGTKLSPSAGPGDGKSLIIPAAVRPGEHTLAIRYFREFDRTPFDKKAPALTRGKETVLALEGRWQAFTEEALPMIQWPVDDPFTRVSRTGSVLYNAMVRPLAPFAVRGVIWYQGESNQTHTSIYGTLFPDMITAWRQTWGEELPFYFVQLAAYGPVETNPNAHGGWAWLREAQEQALALPNTARVTAIDIGDAKNIHPLNKQEVGRRLAATALNKLYGRSEVACEYPQFQSVRFEGNRAIVTFTNARSLKSADGAPIRAFAIADKPGYNRFRWAEVEISGNTVILTHPEMTTVSMVRYAWAGNPDVNLVNETGMPVLPFGLKKP